MSKYKFEGIEFEDLDENFENLEEEVKLPHFNLRELRALYEMGKLTRDHFLAKDKDGDMAIHVLAGREDFFDFCKFFKEKKLIMKEDFLIKNNFDMTPEDCYIEKVKFRIKLITEDDD